MDYNVTMFKETIYNVTYPLYAKLFGLLLIRLPPLFLYVIFTDYKIIKFS